MIENVITFSNVSKTFKSAPRPVLSDISVSISKGEFAFLIGPSGSGKSTFLELIVHEITPDEGDIKVAQWDVTGLKSNEIPKLRQRVGFIFQDFRLLPKKTVFENVAFALEVIGKKKSDIERLVPSTLKLVGLGGKEDCFPAELSGGEQQRVAIARAIVNRPLILLADEPTGNLDPETSRDIMSLLARINSSGTTVLMSTHDDIAVNAMDRRVIELDSGKIVRDDQHGIYANDREGK